MLTRGDAGATITLAGLLGGRRLGILDVPMERRAPPDFHMLVDYVSGYRLPPGAGRHPGDGNGGGAPDRARALAAAIGEAVERYSLACHQPWLMREATRADLPPGQVLDPADHPLFLDAQYATPGFLFPRPRAEDRRKWVAGTRGLTGETLWIPASLVYLPPRGDDLPLTYPLSVGTACAADPWKAAAKAVLELIERDSLTICWETRSTFPAVPQEVTDAVAARLVGPPSALSLRAFDLTTDIGVPVVLTLAMSLPPGPAIAIGSAAGITSAEALGRSVVEAVTSWRSSLRAMRSDSRRSQELLSAMRTTPFLGNHALFYALPENAHHFDFLLAGEATTSGIAEEHIDGAEARESVRTLVQRLETRCCQVFFIDLTPPEIRAAGLVVIRAVVPELVRQSVGLVARHLNNPRLLSVPACLGLAAVATTFDQLLAGARPFP